MLNHTKQHSVEVMPHSVIMTEQRPSTITITSKSDGFAGDLSSMGDAAARESCSRMSSATLPGDIRRRPIRKLVGHLNSIFKVFLTFDGLMLSTTARINLPACATKTPSGQDEHLDFRQDQPRNYLGNV